MKVISKISNFLVFMNNFINIKHLKPLKLLGMGDNDIDPDLV